jgi:hypothetical protein
VADTDIIHVTILNKKQIRLILLARILPKRITRLHGLRQDEAAK